MKSRVVQLIAICIIAIFSFQLFCHSIGAQNIDATLFETPAVPVALAVNERVVTTFSELKDALANNNGITTVYFGADITMQTGGITINSNKSSVEIVGYNPLTPERTEPYTLTDFESSTNAYTIYVNSSNIKNVLVRDMVIKGKNYYGSISTNELTVSSALTITYERVTYSGPQIGYNRQGSLRFNDCDITITGKNGGSTSHEFSETKHLYFEGTNTINTETSTNSVFNLPSGGSFDVLDNSSLTVNSPNTSATFGIFYADATANKITISIGRRSAFNVTAAATFAPTLYSTISSFTVNQGGAFNLTTTKATTGPVLAMGGNLNVGDNASFKINAYSGASYTVIRQEVGDITVGKDATFHVKATNTFTALINLVGRSLVINDPFSVVLYNKDNRDIVATTSAGKIQVDAEQINLWNSTVPSSFNNLPVYGWKKADGSNITMNATLTAGTTANISSISSNYVSGDIPSTAPSVSSFNMATAKVLSFGKLPLHVNTPADTSSAITGTTTSGASVKAEFIQEGVKYVMPEVASHENGNYSIPVSTPLIENTVVTVSSNYEYLFATEVVTVVSKGRIEAIIPETLSFFSTSLKKDSQLINRLEDNWQILISDTRGTGKKWSLYARILEPLTPADQTKPKLENAIVFRNDQDVVQPLESDETVLIYEHTSTSDDDQQDVSWSSNKGILVKMPSGAVYSNIPYTGIIEWSLVEAP